MPRPLSVPALLCGLFATLTLGAPAGADPGKEAAALAGAEKALTAARQTFGPDDSRLLPFLDRLADLAHNLGDCTRAEQLYRQALDLRPPRPGDGPREQADRLRTVKRLAAACGQRGDFPAAERYFREALTTAEKHSGKNSIDCALVLRDLGDLYRRTGDHDRAEAHLLDARIGVGKALGERGREYAETLVAVGRLHQAKGQVSKAEQHLTQALTVARQVPAVEGYLYANVLEALADLYRALKQFDRAEPLYREALDMLRKAVGEDHPDFGAALHNVAAVLQDRGEDVKAEELFVRALKVQTKWLGDGHRDTVATKRDMAALYGMRGDVARAEPLLRQSLEAARDVLELNLAAASERQQLGVLKEFRSGLDLYVSLVFRAGLPADAAYGEVLAWKGAVFARQYRLRQERHHPEFADDLGQLRTVAADLADVVRTGARGLSPETWRRRLDDLTRRKDELEAKVAARVPAVRSRPTPAQVREALPEGAVLVDLLEFRRSTPDVKNRGRWQDEWRMGAFVVPQRGPVLLLDVGPQRELDAAVKEWRASLLAPPQQPPQSDPAGRLRRWIWEPLLPYVKDARSVLISPDGVLARCPFAALPGSQPDRYLIEETPLAVVPVAQLLPDTTRRPSPTDRPPGPPSMLVVGDVDFGAAAHAPAAPRLAERPVAFHGEKHAEFVPLPGAAREGDAVADSFRKAVPGGVVDRLGGAAATEDAFRGRVPGKHYLHLATHGFFSPAKRSEIVPKSIITGVREIAIPNVREILIPKRGPFGTVRMERVTTVEMTRTPVGVSRGTYPLSVEARLEERLAAGHVGLLSGLALAGANRGPQRGPNGNAVGDDGILTALEVVDLDLRGSELVVLSACETGLGESAGGEGLLGLQRAFQVSGARSTLASLWKVDDEATRVLMGRFYDNLWGRGLGKLEALREAQLAVLRGESVPVGGARGIGEVVPAPDAAAKRVEPRYWAAWVLSGDPGGMTEPALPPPTLAPPSAEAAPNEATPSTWGGREAALAAAVSAGVAALAALAWWRVKR